jgi:enoyl-CoA hydratase
MQDPILIDRPIEHVAVVTMNRPSAANAIDGALAEQLGGAVRAIEADPEIRAAIITGAGRRAFCGGADLKEVAAGNGWSFFTKEGGFAGFVDAARDKPWIAAIEGGAFGGGLEIALACDFIIASDDAQFGLPEVKYGLLASAGGVFRLPRRIGRGAAFRMIATGEPIHAEQAERLGLVDQRVPSGTALNEALALAGTIAANAPIAVRESLKIARAASTYGEEALRKVSEDAGIRISRTEDFQEGARSFVEKRKPQWRGR